MKVSLNTNDSLILEQNYNTIISSYNTLKMILEPNITEDKKNLMNFLLETIISQLKFLLDLNTISSFDKIYELLNINNQQLSKLISCLFSIFDVSNSHLEKSNNYKNEKKCFDNLKIESFNYNYNRIYVNRNYDSIIQQNNGYDKDEESHTNNDKNYLNNNYNLIKINKKKFELKKKEKDNDIINTSHKNLFKKPFSNFNDKNIISSYYKKNKDIQKDMSYNLNINIYSNHTNDNSRNSIKTNYNLAGFLQNKNNNESNHYKSKSKKKQKNLSKNKYQNIHTKIGLNTQRGKRDEINKVKNLNNKSNQKTYKFKISPKMNNIQLSQRSSKKNIRPTYYDRGAFQMCQTAINNYYKLEKKHFEYYLNKRRSRSQNRCLTFNKTSIPSRVTFSSSCPKRKYIFLDNL